MDRVFCASSVIQLHSFLVDAASNVKFCGAMTFG